MNMLIIIILLIVLILLANSFFSADGTADKNSFVVLRQYTSKFDLRAPAWAQD